MQKWKKYFVISDILVLYLAFVLAVIVRGLIHKSAAQTEAVWLAAHTFIFLPSFVFSILALYISGLYDAKIIYDRVKTYVLLFYAQITVAIFSVLTFYFVHTSLTPKLTIFIYVIFSTTLLSLSRSFLFKRIQNLPKAKAIFLSHTENLLVNLKPEHAPFELLFYNNLEAASYKIYENRKISNFVYDEKVLNVELSLFLEKLKQENIAVYSYNQYFEFLYKKIDFENLFFDDLVRNISENKESIGHYVFRRCVDIICGLLILPFFVLSLPLVYIGIYIQDGGKIFSIQNRVSFLGKLVNVFKIRTMTNTDAGGIVAGDNFKNEKSKFGNTVTAFGKFLRKTRIDELPQCLNLLKGDISFIGPRADILGVHEDMKTHINNYKLRLLVPQGLTGWAQVHMNFPPRTWQEHKERLAFDLYYIRNRTILLDISVILKTIKTLISREGA